MSRPRPAPRHEYTPEERADLRRRGEAGDTLALGELTYLHHDIDDTGIEAGDLAARAERAIIEVATTTLEEHAALVRHLAKRRTELDGPSATPLERDLVDRVLTCELLLDFLHERFVRAYREGDMAAQKHLDRLIDGAHRRYLSAVKSLAQVRHLITPVVQLNVANQQVNVVSASGLGQGDGAG